ncbi:MAG TPA: PilZ domain-containing protein [Aurantimonas sp.]|uniref:PilZ domain-containing protein n=1 Tax=Aurantimonas marianensis TaxID=2920428 RepID=A0A9X2HCF5_9HYPH|nr:PilZ domain-containing protein [Aurantimonas marianensis]MCP3055114.1 PilZ domain-containing protein [Aurantimonas marianensis]
MAALPELEPDGSERRVAQRMRTLKRAKVIFNDGFSTFDCIVRNLSATGALLTIDEAAHLPKAFEIRVGEDQHVRPARLVYRRAMFAGIRFLDIPKEQNEGGSASPDHSADSNGSNTKLRDDAQPGSINRVEPESLPPALTRLFAWSRDNPA